MVSVRIDAQSRKELMALLQAEGPTACVMIHRNAPRADLKRTPEGSAAWSIERPDPWGANVAAGLGIVEKDVVVIDGVRFWFAVLEPEKIPPLELLAAQGRVHVRIAN
jgi:hypothetical protein